MKRVLYCDCNASPSMLHGFSHREAQWDGISGPNEHGSSNSRGGGGCVGSLLVVPVQHHVPRLSGSGLVLRWPGTPVREPFVCRTLRMISWIRCAIVLGLGEAGPRFAFVSDFKYPGVPNQGCIRTAANHRRSPPLRPFQCLRLTVGMDSRSCFRAFGARGFKHHKCFGTIQLGGPWEEGGVRPTPPLPSSLPIRPCPRSPSVAHRWCAGVTRHFALVVAGREVICPLSHFRAGSCSHA